MTGFHGPTKGKIKECEECELRVADRPMGERVASEISAGFRSLRVDQRGERLPSRHLDWAEGMNV